MATVSRSRAGAKQPRPPLATLAAIDALRTWVVPTVAVVGMLAFAALGVSGIVATPRALAGTIGAALILLLFIAERPLVAEERSTQERALGAALAIVWFVACYAPFHARLFPGRPLVDQAAVSASGQGLPLRIPAAGVRAVDLVLEGRLAPSEAGGVAPPVHYQLTIEGGGGARSIEGLFEDRLATRRLGRRGSAVVHQTHTADVRVLGNPGRGDLTITRVVLEPDSAQPIDVSVFAHPLPGTPVLVLAAAALIAAAVAFDRLGPVAETDGAFTLSTAAVIGTALIFWTSNAVHPDFPALVGSVIFGGPIGFAAGALVWWTAKRLIVRPAR